MKNIQKNLKTLALSTAFMLTTLAGFAQEKKQEQGNKKSNDTTTVKKTVVDGIKKGTETVKTYQYADSLKQGNTVIKRSGSFYSKELDLEGETKAQKAKEKGKIYFPDGTEAKSWSDYWKNLDKHATEAQAAKVREIEAKRNKKKGKKAAILKEEKEQVKETHTTELIEKTVYDSVPVPVYIKPLPLAKAKGSFYLGVGPVYEQFQDGNINLYNPTGIAFEAGTDFANKGIFAADAYFRARYHKGTDERYVYMPGKDDCNCPDGKAEFRPISDGGNDYINAEIGIEAGLEIPLFKYDLGIDETKVNVKNLPTFGRFNLSLKGFAAVGYAGLLGTNLDGSNANLPVNIGIYSEDDPKFPHYHDPAVLTNENYAHTSPETDQWTQTVGLASGGKARFEYKGKPKVRAELEDGRTMKYDQAVAEGFSDQIKEVTVKKSAFYAALEARGTFNNRPDGYSVVKSNNPDNTYNPYYAGTAADITEVETVNGKKFEKTVMLTVGFNF